MAEVPSLLSLCLKAVSVSIIHGYDHLQDLFELPPYFLDSLIVSLPPLALQNIHELSIDCCGKREFTADGIDNQRKHGRYDAFNEAWKVLYAKRWLENFKKMQLTSSATLPHGVGIFKPVNYSLDWQQLYWEAHLQNCLDEAAERALLPSFDEHIGGIEISDCVLHSIGCIGATTHDCSKLSYHCNKFGQYARYLRLQNVFCVAETCALLETCKLQGLVFRRILSHSHVDGMCKLLKQNRETLLSIELLYCHLPPTGVNQIFYSIFKEGSGTHGIRHLCIRSSHIFGYKSCAVPAGLSSFLSSGRALESLCFSDTHMGSKIARFIVSTLQESSSNLISLEISDNELAGWVSKRQKESTGLSSLSNVSLKSLNVLNLRSNNFCEDDVEGLSHALSQMPNLRSIDMSDNPIADDGIRKLIPYFIKAFEKVYPISDIKLENCNLSGLGVAELLRCLPVSKEPLHSFSIANNDLGSSVAAMLAKFLVTSHVRVLDIEDIGLGPPGFQEFEKEMPSKVEVVCINISKNRGGIRTAHFVSELILHAPQLVTVNAGYNLMPPESLPVIRDALKQSKGKKLEQLDLTGNTHLCASMDASTILEFQYRGKSILTVPSFPSLCTPYDDDP